MTFAQSSHAYPESNFQTTARHIASFLPIFILGYSALIDPLINFDPTPKVYFGGMQIGASVKSTIATKIVIPALLSISILLAMISPMKYPRIVNKISVPLFAYLGLAVLSGLWSRDFSNTVTLATYQIILCGSLFLAIGVANDIAKIMRNLLWLFFIIVCINMVFAVVLPPGPIGHQGIYNYKNTLGGAAGCAVILAVFHLRAISSYTRVIALLTLIGAVFLLVVSDSKTGIVMAFAAPIVTIIWLAISRLFRVGIFVSASAVLITLAAMFIIFSNVLNFESRDISLVLFGDDTFTGRTYVWDFVVSHIKESPIIGQGYRGFWGIGAESPSNHSEIEFIRIAGSSHNGFLDALLDLGIIGLFIQIFFILAILAASIRITSTREFDSRIFIAITIFIVGRNMMESVILWSTIFDNLLLVSVGFLACLSAVPASQQRATFEQDAHPPYPIMANRRY